MDTYRIASDRLAVTIAALGAEPQSVRHADAGEVLWQAGPAWPRHAPVLFPIVGQLVGNAYRLDGKTYAMERHGFARFAEFAWLEREASTCTLRLVADAKTARAVPVRLRARHPV